MTIPLSELLEARYGTPVSVPDVLVTKSNTTIETVLSHRSIRSYEQRPLEAGVLELLVVAAQSASTSSNLQSYSIIAVEDKDRKEKLSEICGHQQQIIDAPLFLLFCADLARSKTICDMENGPSTGLDYTEMFIMAVIDTALAAQNLSITAEALGLGICYIGGARNHPKQLAVALDLPPKVFTVFGLTVGYPLGKTEKVKPRLPQTGAILHRERYVTTKDSILKEYEQTINQFNDGETGRRGRGWLKPTSQRVATGEALGAERSAIKQFLQEAGLDLR
jgi:nitroreductase